MRECCLLLIAAWLLGGEAPAQPPRGNLKWHYATLTRTGNAVAGYAFRWETGKKTWWSRPEKTEELSLTRLYKDLGGKDEQIRLVGFLDHVGQDEWELVTHAQLGDEISWTFKRPAR